MNKQQLWTKDYLIDSMANLIIYLVFYLLTVIIVDYAMDNLQASPSEAGLAAGIFIVAGLFGRIFAGRSMAQVGLKKMLYLGLSIFLAATLLYFMINNLLILFCIRFLHGIGFGIASTATGTIVANITPKERRGEGIGYYALSVTIATAIGPFLGMYLHQHGSFNMILALCTILSIVNCIAACFLKVPEVNLTGEQLDKMKQFTLDNFIEYKALPIAIIGAFMGLSYSSIVSFLSSYTRQINLMDMGSMFFIVYAVFILISRPLTGPMSDRKGENYVMYPAFLLFAIGLVILSQVHQGFILLLAGAFIGLGYGTFTPIAQAISVKVSPPHRVGLATSTFFAIFDAGMGIGPFILGFLVPTLGFRGLYIGMSIVVVICMFLYYVLHGSSANETELITDN
ncbi:MAG: MFS transporter [Pelosinus sp.]|nr:MFS transporter [Pelosinus sp.]